MTFFKHGLKKINDSLAGIPATLISGAFLILSFVPPRAGAELPIDPAWAAIIISGTPLRYLAVWRIIHNPGINKISSALLIVIAMFAAIGIGDLFAAGEVVFTMAASTEAKSEHPLGKAIVSYARAQDVFIQESSVFKMTAGRGVCTEVSRQKLLCGNEKFLIENGIAVGGSIRDGLERLRAEGKASILAGHGKQCVGVAMSGIGNDIALMSGGISQIPYPKRLSNTTVRTIKCSIALSMCIDFAAVTLSVMQVLTPTTGALIHNAGSCLVELISALLYDRRFEDREVK